MKDWKRGEKTWEWSFLSAYPLFIFLGIIASLITVYYFWQKQKYSLEILQVLLIIIVPTSIIGARLWWVVSENKWSEWYAIHNGGLSIQGGVMLSTLCASWYLLTKRHVIDFRTAFGIILPSVLIGQVLGRWGNFNNHEVYGHVVDGQNLNWLGSWIKGHMYIESEYRQPFFLYESFANFLAYIFIVWLVLRKNWLKPGTTGGLYLVWYGILRLIMEPLRDPSDIMKPAGNFQMSTFVAALWIVAGIGFIIWYEILTMPSIWTQKYLKWLSFSKKEYDIIHPIKPRRLFWFGKKSDEKKKYLFWGKILKNKIKIFIPKEDRKWSKRELNAGRKSR